MLLVTEQDIIDNPKRVVNLLIEHGLSQEEAEDTVNGALEIITDDIREERFNQSLAEDVASASAECPHKANALDEFEHGLNHGVEIGKTIAEQTNAYSEARLGSFADAIEPEPLREHVSFEQQVSALATAAEGLLKAEASQREKAQFALNVLVSSPDGHTKDAAKSVILSYLRGTN